MSATLYALGRWAFRARGRVLALWLVVLAALIAGAGLLGVGTDNTYRIPGTESQQALDGLARTFPQVAGASAQLIAVAPDGTSVTDPAFEAAVEAAVDAISALPQVEGASSPYGSSSSANLADDGSAALVPIQLSVSSAQVLPATADALQRAGADLEAALPDGSEVAVGGQLFAQDPAGISVTELLGILVAYVVLLITFGSLIAAGLPLVTALAGVGASLSIVLIGTRFMTITSTTPLLALMLGLAVGIDYALFIVSRHQDQLRHGLEPEESAARAIATSGSAVVFAAATVVIALLGLAVAGIPFLTVMGAAAALAVAIAVLVALTLTPALLGFAGWRIVARRHRPAAEGRPRTKDASAQDASPPEASPDTAVPDSPEPDAPEPAETVSVEPVPEPETSPDAPADAHPPTARGIFPAWVRTVTRWPAATVIVIVALLGLAALPALQLRLALPDAGSLDEAAPGRIAYDLIAGHFGPGYNGPLLVTGQVIQSTDPVGLLDDIATEIAAVPGVAKVPLATPNETGDTGIVQVVPEGSPDSEATAELVAALRGMHDHFEAEYGVSLAVTGYTAAGIDISAQLGGALAPFGLLVVGLSLVLLAMVFRSIVVPVTAALGYALSIAAAFGLTSLVFVDGVGAELLNVAEVGSVVSFMPIILMGVLFGLAMDYEVFLVSRMREDWVHHGEARGAVERGFVQSARVVTAAALIMFAVFAAFVPEGDASIQPIAFGLAVGVAIDAFLVRMTLIPAVLVLFGERAWWIPRSLDRALPHFDIEGEGLAEEFALADWPEPDARFAVAAEGVLVRGLPYAVDAMAAPGEALVVDDEVFASAAHRSAVLLALGGRRLVDEGLVKVAGLVLPARAAAVRARSAYVRTTDAATAVAAVADGLADRPEVLLLDAAEGVAEPAVRSGIRRLIAEASTRAPLTVVVAVRAEADAEALLPAGTVRRRMRPAVAEPAPEPDLEAVP